MLCLGSPKNSGKSKEPRFVSDAIDGKVKLCCFRIAIYLQYVSSLLASIVRNSDSRLST